jgi:FkbH-like protein
VAALVASKVHRVFAITVSDRFGSYGLVGAAIVDASDPSTWDLDSLLMSCRVLRRGVETGLLAAIASRAVQAGASCLVGRYIPSAKNGQVESFYTDHGFARADEGTFVFGLDVALPVPTHIDFVTDA